MINEVHLIVRRGQNIDGNFEEPSAVYVGTSNKIGVNFFDGIFSLVGLPITIIAADLTEYDGGLVNAVNFEAVWAGLYDINYDNDYSCKIIGHSSSRKKYNSGLNSKCDNKKENKRYKNDKLDNTSPHC